MPLTYACCHMLIKNPVPRIPGMSDSLVLSFSGVHSPVSLPFFVDDEVAVIGDERTGFAAL